MLHATVDRLQKTQSERLQALAAGLATLQENVSAWQADGGGPLAPKPRKR